MSVIFLAQTVRIWLHGIFGLGRNLECLILVALVIIDTEGIFSKMLLGIFSELGEFAPL